MARTGVPAPRAQPQKTADLATLREPMRIVQGQDIGQSDLRSYSLHLFEQFDNRKRAFIVWRITAKKRMVAKLKAIKAELQHRKHQRTTEVGAWLRQVVLSYYQYHAVPGNSTQLRIFQ